MILTTTTAAVPFTPDWLAGKPDAPVFLLRAGSLIERGQMEAELAGEHRAGPVFYFEVHAAIQADINLLLADDPERGRALELVELERVYETDKAEALAAGREPPADPLSAIDRQQLVEIRRILAEHGPEYREVIARGERRRQIAPLVAFRKFCIGWTLTDGDGKPIPFERAADGQVADGALRRLDPLLLIAAGNRAFALQYGSGEEKNSAPPSASGEAPKASGRGGGSKAGGRSTGTAGRKTRG